MATEPQPDAESVPLTSSVPVELPEPQETLFREALAVLQHKGVAYAVSGAFALRQHTGICRFTKDLDIFLSPRSVPSAMAHLKACGFECEVCDPVWLAKGHRDGYFVDLITGMSNGAIMVDSSWIERAHSAVLLGVRTQVLAPEELLASKLFVLRRERFDGADIAHIIYALRGKLDWGRVLQLAGEHWEILLWALMLFHYVYPAHADYVPRSLWRSLLARFRREIRSPDPKARFRGSLVDDKMFAIDVNEWGLDDVLAESQARVAKILTSPEGICA